MATENRYCLPIRRDSREGVRDEIASAASDYAYFEVWLDYVDDIDLYFIQELVEAHGERVVFVFRRGDLAPTTMNPLFRDGILKRLSGAPVRVDLDITQHRRELDLVKSSGYDLRLITSYHNFDRTPSDADLERIIESMIPYRPEIIKIAAKCLNRGDAIRLLSLLVHLTDSGTRCIILGMGEFGLLTRIGGSLWGNELAFAPRSVDAASAPGQLSRDDLHSILSILQGGRHAG